MPQQAGLRIAVNLEQSRRSFRWEGTVLKPLINLLVLLLCPFTAAAQESHPSTAATPDSFTIPAEAVHQVNPVKPTAESIAQGKKYYGYDCAMCHGNNGDGKGEVAIAEKLTLIDFSDTGD